MTLAETRSLANVWCLRLMVRGQGVFNDLKLLSIICLRRGGGIQHSYWWPLMLG